MTADNTADGAPPRATGGRVRRVLAHWRAIVLTVLVIGATAFASGYFYLVYRPDVQTDSAAVHQAVMAASDGAVALLSYSPDTLSRDLTNAKSLVTEDYLTYYQQFADQIVGPAAQRGQVTTTTTVVKAAVSEMHPNSAVVLAFIKLKTERKDQPEPVVTSSSLRVTLTKVHGSWLIEKLEAV